MDRSGMIADITGIQNAMDMYDACGELLGFLDMANYDDIAALNVSYLPARKISKMKPTDAIKGKIQ